MTRSAKHATTKSRHNKKYRGVLLAAAVTTVPFLAALPATVSAPMAAAAEADYFGPEPATVLTMALFGGTTLDDLSGVVCESPRTCVAVPFPYLERNVGLKDLQKAMALDTSGQRQIIYGYSQGARVASEWLEKYGAADGSPSPEELSFVLIGNPGRKHGGAHVGWGQTTVDTKYDVLDVAREYDMTADYPDHPMNLLALANAYAGLIYLHGHYEGIDIYSPDNYVWKDPGTNTTYVLVPTENIPLLEPLRKMGLDKLADKLNAPLKEKIDKGYDRSYLPAQTGWPADLPPGPEAAQAVSALPQSGQTMLTVAPTVQTVVPKELTTRRHSDPGPAVDVPDSGGDLNESQPPAESTPDPESTGDSDAAGDTSAADGDAAANAADDAKPTASPRRAGHDSQPKHRNIFKRQRVAQSD